MDAMLVQNLVELILWAVTFLAVVASGCVCVYLHDRERRLREEAADRLAAMPATVTPPRPLSEAVVAAIELLDFVSSRRQATGDDECVVCLEAMEAGEVCCALPKCGHEFHRDCMKKWFNAGKSTCPVCRAKAQWPSMPLDHIV